MLGFQNGIFVLENRNKRYYCLWITLAGTQCQMDSSRTSVSKNLDQTLPLEFSHVMLVSYALSRPTIERGLYIVRSVSLPTENVDRSFTRLTSSQLCVWPSKLGTQSLQQQFRAAGIIPVLSSFTMIQSCVY